MGKMINLKKKDESISMASSEVGKNKSHGKMVSFYDAPEFPIDEKEVGKTMKAEVEIIPREVGMRQFNGQKSFIYELEMTGIKFMKSGAGEENDK